jgi:hypothetical protein
MIWVTQALVEEKGQAATEFLIAAIFVLIPLFLIVSLMGKYIDIKQAAIGQARFEAWEYTAWFMNKKRILSYPRDYPNEKKRRKKKHTQRIRAAVRPWQEVRRTGKQIFFSDISSGDYGKNQQRASSAANILNPLWRDHRNDSLFVESYKSFFEDKITCSNKRSTQICEHETPDPTGKNYVNDVINAIETITEKVKEVLSFEGQHAGFDALNTYGYFQSRIKFKLRSPNEVLPVFSLSGVENQNPEHLTFHAKSSVLAETWEAGSTQNSIYEIQGLVLTSFLEPLSKTLNDTLDWLQDKLSGLSLGPVSIDVEIPRAPAFGYVKNGLLPYEHVQGSKAILKRSKGLYYYDEE